MKFVKWGLLISFIFMVSFSLMITGCGDKEKAAYQEYYDKTFAIKQNLEDKMKKLEEEGQKMNTEDPSQLKPMLESFIADMQTAKTDTEKITPPEKMKTAHQELIAAYQSAIDMATIAKSLTEIDLKNIEKLDEATMKKLQSIGQELATKQQEFEKHGKAWEDQVYPLLKEKGIAIKETPKKEETTTNPPTDTTTNTTTDTTTTTTEPATDTTTDTTNTTTNEPTTNTTTDTTSAPPADQGSPANH